MQSSHEPQGSEQKDGETERVFSAAEYTTKLQLYRKGWPLIKKLIERHPTDASLFVSRFRPILTPKIYQHMNLLNFLPPQSRGSGEFEQALTTAIMKGETEAIDAAREASESPPTKRQCDTPKYMD